MESLITEILSNDTSHTPRNRWQRNPPNSLSHPMLNMIAIWGNKEHLTCVFPLWFSRRPNIFKKRAKPSKIPSLLSAHAGIYISSCPATRSEWHCPANSLSCLHAALPTLCPASSAFWAGRAVRTLAAHPCRLHREHPLQCKQKLNIC